MSLFACNFNPSSNWLVSDDAQLCVQRSNDRIHAFTWDLFLLWLFSRVVRRPSLVSWSFLFANLKVRAGNKQYEVCNKISWESSCSRSRTYWRISICLSRLSLSSEKDLIRASSLHKQTVITRLWIILENIHCYFTVSTAVQNLFNV